MSKWARSLGLPFFLLAALTSAPGCGTPHAGSESRKQERPNIVVILVDDLRYDTLGITGHPFVETPHIDRLSRGGAHFTHSFVTDSLCSPSRASLLTGLYPHIHGVTTNQGADLPLDTQTFPALLQAAGWNTSFVGKWHMAHRGEPRPGFDDWYSFQGQGDYLDPVIHGNTTTEKTPGYVTDLLTDHAVEWIGQQSGDRPFCLVLSHKATHSPMLPAARHKGRYATEAILRPPALDDALEGKPEALRRGAQHGFQTAEFEARSLEPVLARVPLLGPDAEWPAEPYVREYLETLLAVDDSVGRVFTALDEQELLENTILIFTSDNGFLFGEHAAPDKRLAWEDSIHVPLMVYAPGRVQPGTRVDELVLNIDIAPTLLDLAGVEQVSPMQGESFRELLEGGTIPWREDFFYTYFREEWLAGIPTTLGIRSNDWKYVVYPEFPSPNEELYDLASDPHELENLAASPEQADRLAHMRARLEESKDHFNYELPAHAQPVRFDPATGESSPQRLDLSRENPLPEGIRLNRRAFEITLTLTARNSPPDGLLLKYGGPPNGFLLTLEKGVPVFTFHAAGLARRVRAETSIAGRSSTLRFGLDLEGRVYLGTGDGEPTRATLRIGGIAGRARNEMRAASPGDPGGCVEAIGPGTLTWLGRQQRGGKSGA